MTIDTEPGTTGKATIYRSVTRGNVGGRLESAPHLRFPQRGKAALQPSWLAIGTFVAVLAAPVGTASALEGVRFETFLSAAQEVQEPPVESEGTGRGIFRFADDLSELEARVDVEGLTGEVTAAHLHCAIAGVSLEDNIFVDLVPALPDGRIVDDVFDNEDVTVNPTCVDACGFEINNIASLRKAADDGCVYLNVHTDEFPDGEVRGQLLVR
jgi:hypothetical protein